MSGQASGHISAHLVITLVTCDLLMTLAEGGYLNRRGLEMARAWLLDAGTIGLIPDHPRVGLALLDVERVLAAEIGCERDELPGNAPLSPDDFAGGQV